MPVNSASILSGYSYGWKIISYSLLWLICIKCYGVDTPASAENSCAPSHDKITPIDSISEFIAQAIELSKSKKVLVVFDIDDVLIHRLRRYRQLAANQYNPSYTALRTDLLAQAQEYRVVGLDYPFGSSHHFVDALPMPAQEPGPEEHIEERLVQWVNHLTNIADVICLTARNIWRRAPIQNFGINLTLPANRISLDESQVRALTSSGASYDGNVIYTDGGSKGEPLLNFLHGSSAPYDAILFVDNNRINVENVVATLSARDCSAQGFWLTSGSLGECRLTTPERTKVCPFFHGDQNDGQNGDQNDENEDDGRNDDNPMERSDSWPDLT